MLCTEFSVYGSTVPSGPEPPHFSRLQDHT